MEKARENLMEFLFWNFAPLYSALIAPELLSNYSDSSQK
jgi:hypothetical protein